MTYQIQTDAPGFIYFFGTCDGAFVKIGYSRFPDRRYQEIQRISPLRIMSFGWWAGKPSHERAIHNKFRHYWSVGEWFRAYPEILEFIAAAESAGEIVLTPEELVTTKNPLPTSRSHWTPGAPEIRAGGG